ncbi:MAG TPA: dipeptide epimerase [Chitinophagales bacterium]|nr:dipeptide epimerase [Chitinophagales bacterium]
MVHITSIHAYLQRLPLKQPYAIAYQTIYETEIVFLEIALSNGIIGYGASNPFPEVIGETPEQTLGLLQSESIQKHIGKSIDAYREIISDCCRDLPDYPGTQAALDIALHDAYGKVMQQPIAALYGQVIASLPTSITIGIKTLPEMIEDATHYYHQGFRILKLKTGISVDEDIERCIKLYEHFGDQFRYRVDANLGYNFASLNKFIHETAHLPIELIEQPLPVSENQALVQFAEPVRMKFVADESLTSISSAEKLLQHPHPFGVFNIKLMKAGGILAGKHIADTAASKGISIFWGCNDESLVSITAALHLAYACPNTKYLDLDGSFDVLEHVFSGGFILENGHMRLNGKPGLGVYKK